MVGNGPLWRTAAENPKATTLGLLFALTIALAAFGVSVDLLGAVSPPIPSAGTGVPDTVGHAAGLRPTRPVLISPLG